MDENYLKKGGVFVFVLFFYTENNDTVTEDYFHDEGSHDF